MQTPTESPKKPRQRRRRCDNCSKFFPIDPSQPKKRFRQESCRYQFHKYGMAYGPLKIRLEKLVSKIIQGEVEQLNVRFTLATQNMLMVQTELEKVLSRRIAGLEERISDLESELIAEGVLTGARYIAKVANRNLAALGRSGDG